MIICHQALSLYEHDENIALLTAQNFDDLVVKSNSMWVVNFYSSRCRHSINIAPEFSRIAKRLRYHFFIGAIDCIQEKELCFRLYRVYGFPAILFLYDKLMIEYRGDINVDNVSRAAFAAFNDYVEYFS